MEDKSIKKNTVHHTLAHSYSVYFILLLVGVVLHIIYDFKIFHDVVVLPIGFVFLILATILIIWAQKTGRDFREIGQELKPEHFYRGPYRYTRIPTQWGLFILLLGFGIITNSFFVIIFTILAFFISKFVFMGKHQRILAEKYGSAYIEYMRKVKF